MSLAQSTTPAPFGRGNLRVCRAAAGAVVLAALWRPATRNAFDDHLYNDLIDLLDAATADDTVAVVVLTGGGPFFSSGADLRATAGPDGTFAPPPGGRRTWNRQASGRFMKALLRFPKLLAAAVNGPAVGIGATLLLHCDLVFCAPRASLWMPFARLALVPELASSAALPAAIGAARANDLLLLGRRNDAATALAWGLCSRVVEDGGGGSDDPFAPNSLAHAMAREIQTQLLALPHGAESAQHFVALLRGGRRRRLMEAVCQEELRILDARFDAGQVAEAAARLRIGSSARASAEAPRSRL